jgi:hypothetical protein
LGGRKFFYVEREATMSLQTGELSILLPLALSLPPERSAKFLAEVERALGGGGPRGESAAHHVATSLLRRYLDSAPPGLRSSIVVVAVLHKAMTMPRVVSLTDEQLELVMTYARPLRHSKDRAAYLERVALLLRRHSDIGDGLVARIARHAQKEFMRPTSGSKTIAVVNDVSGGDRQCRLPNRYRPPVCTGAGIAITVAEDSPTTRLLNTCKSGTSITAPVSLSVVTSSAMSANANRYFGPRAPPSWKAPTARTLIEDHELALEVVVANLLDRIE